MIVIKIIESIFLIVKDNKISGICQMYDIPRFFDL